MQVWIVESGEYEQRYVVVIADSIEAAIKYVKERLYGLPYKVQWFDLIYDEEADYYQMKGTFDYVPDLSGAHTKYFDITPIEVYDDRD